MTQVQSRFALYLWPATPLPSFYRIQLFAHLSLDLFVINILQENRIYLHSVGPGSPDQPPHTLAYISEDNHFCLSDVCRIFLNDYETFHKRPFASSPANVVFCDDAGRKMSPETPVAQLEDRCDVFLESIGKTSENIHPLPAKKSTSPSSGSVAVPRSTKPATLSSCVSDALQAIKLARECQATGKLRKAREHFHRALSKVEDESEAHAPDVTTCLQICHQQLGVIEAHNNFWEKSLEHLQKAFEICEQKRIQATSQKDEDKLEFARLLELLGEAHFGCSDFPTAAAVFKRALDLVKGVSRTLLLKKETKRQIQDLQIWLARSLYAQADAFDYKQVAIKLFEDSLAQDETHPETLAHYSVVAIDHGQAYNAIPYMLRALVQCTQRKSAGEYVRRETSQLVGRLLAKVVGDQQGVEALMGELHGAAMSASALVFLAQTIKDNGSIPSSISLYEKALNIAGDMEKKGNLVLNLVHTQEVCYKYQEAFVRARAFVRESADQRVGGNGVEAKAREFFEIIENITNITAPELRMGTADTCPEYHAPPEIFDAQKIQVMVPGMDQEKDKAAAKKAPKYSEKELDLLALYFATVKILYVSGALQVIPALVKLLVVKLPAHSPPVNECTPARSISAGKIDPTPLLSCTCLTLV